MIKFLRFRYLLALLPCLLIGGVAFNGSSYLWKKWQFNRDYRAAKHGDIAAQNRVGCAYDGGEVVTQNDALAVEWYRKAAEQGFAKSQHNLAWMYANGRGVEQDWQQAVAWYQKAAEQNYVNSIVNLGNCYSRGNGVEWDKQKALYWYQKSADLGDDMAQHHLADLYLNGYVENKNKFFAQYEKKSLNRRVLRDEAKARYWFEKSAQQGYAESQYKLAKLYIAENGRFGKDAEAVKWLKKAGSNGIAEAYTLTGMMYLNGRGVAKSKPQAARYFLMAFKGGHLDAGKFLLPCILPVEIK